MSTIKLISSQDRLLQTAHVASFCGASNVAFHAAFYMKDNPEEVYAGSNSYLPVLPLKSNEQNKYHLAAAGTNGKNQPVRQPGRNT